MNITVLTLLICVSFCFFIFFYFKWYIKRRTSVSVFLSEYQTEVHRLIAEIDSATDRDSMLVEDRIKQLKTILEETDKRVAVYARELDRSRTGEALYTSLGRGIRAALNTSVEASAVLTAKPPVQTPQPQTTPVIHQAEPLAEPIQTETSPPAKRQLRSQIETMVNDGFSPAEIASRLEISIAEVDLAINLLNRL